MKRIYRIQIELLKDGTKLYQAQTSNCLFFRYNIINEYGNISDYFVYDNTFDNINKAEEAINKHIENLKYIDSKKVISVTYKYI